MENPYSHNPDCQFWSRTVAARHRTAFDPVVQPRFQLGAGDAIATLGSCFAQHLTRWLVQHGCNFLYTDRTIPFAEIGSVLFSANYGNVYTVAQALQLFRAACGRQSFSDQVWRSRSGAWIDPLRPLVPGGPFALAEDLLASRQQLWQAVRDMLAQHQCLVFTLGLTEAWIRLEDGAVLPTAPGVAGGEFRERDYQFCNYSYPQVVDGLVELVGLVRELNPHSRLLRTVSPVPLAATHENRHVAVSSMASKAILRAAADDLCRRFEFVDYFPSFELFYTPGLGHMYYEQDLRHVTAGGVRRAMGLFQKHYLGDAPAPAPARAPGLQEIRYAQDDIVCNEDLLI